MRPLAYTVSRAGCPPGKGTTPAKLLVMGAMRPGTAAVLSSGGECSPAEQKNIHEEPGPGSGPAHPSLGLWQTLTRGRGDGCGRQPIKADGANLLDVAG